MATKRKKAATGTLQSRVSEMQKRAEKTLRRSFELLPPVPRKTVRGWVAELDKAGTGLRKRAERAVQEARRRLERFGSEVQRRIDKAVTPVTRRLDLASRKDIEALRRRVEQIERRLSEPVTPETRSAAA